MKFPSRISELAKAVLTQLLQKDPGQRLGGSKRDVEEVKEHPFFDSINWQDLYNKKVPPPFTPVVTSETDVRNFDPEFTSENPDLTPPDNSEWVDNAMSGCGIVMSRWVIVMSRCGIVMSGCRIVMSGCGIVMSGCGIVMSEWGNVMSGWGIVMSRWIIVMSGWGLVMSRWVIVMSGCGIVMSGWGIVMSRWVIVEWVWHCYE